MPDRQGELQTLATRVIAAITLLFTSRVPRVPNLSFNDSEGLFGFGSYRDFNHNWFANVLISPTMSTSTACA